ncbi:MAG: hypothetical protein DRG24_01750 [Epsilonproteobacteria bacterium]|nr:MAG: hypothetical protein DRG24_01750 [Campylobacterota bacterium]
MRFFFLPLLFLMLAFTSTLSAQSDNIIVVGAFYTQEQADRRLSKLKEAMHSQGHVVTLQNDLGFDYHTKRLGKFYIVTISPFKNKGDLQNVLGTVKIVYPDAYAHKVKLSAPVETKVVEEVPEVAEVVEVPEVVKVSEVVKVVEVAEVVEESAKVEERPAEVIEAVDETEIETAVPLPKVQEEGSLNLMIYGIAALVGLLLLIVILLKRGKKEEPAPPELRDIKVEEPVTVSSPVQEEVAEYVPEIQEKFEPEIPEVVVEEVSQVKEVAATPETVLEPMVVSRRKREPIVHSETITKDNLSDFKGNRILVAEDNMINQKVITKLMEGSGIEIVIADDGQIAMDILEKDSNFQVILMDAHMPRKDGFEATREIRANPDYDHITVVALSGDISSDDIRKMKEAGMEEQLAKPLRIEKLYDVLYSYCDLESDEEETAPSDRQVLNIEEGLEISGGHMDLYKEVLEEFAEEYRESAELLERYLSEHNYELLGMLLLDVHGIAGNIGADVLSYTAEELREAVLEKRTGVYENLAARYKKDLDALLESIKNQ